MVREKTRCSVAGFEDRGRGCELGWLLGAKKNKKGKKADSPLEPPGVQPHLD